MPGDKVLEQEHNCNKPVKEEKNFAQLIVISEDSFFCYLWGIIYLLACFTSPYFYAWVALFGHEKGEKGYLWVSICFESLFAMNILVNMLTDYVPDGEIIPERDIAKIAERYLKEEFMIDFIPTFPFTFFFDNSKQKYWRLFYLIRIIRILKGIEIYDVQMIMDYLKEKNT